jgi:hypothetical protein
MKNHIQQLQKLQVELAEEAKVLGVQQKGTYEKRKMELKTQQKAVDEKIQEIKKGVYEKRKEELKSSDPDQSMLNDKLLHFYSRDLAMNKGLALQKQQSNLAFRKNSLFLKNSAQKELLQNQRTYKLEVRKKNLLLKRQQDQIEMIDKAIQKTKALRFD